MRAASFKHCHLTVDVNVWGAPLFRRTLFR